MRWCGSNPPGLPSWYFIVSDATTPCRAPIPADPAEATPAVADRPLLDDEPILAVFALDEVRRPVSEFRIHVFVPQIQRFEDMAVRIDDIVSATHDQFPSC